MNETTHELNSTENILLGPLRQLADSFNNEMNGLNLSIEQDGLTDILQSSVNDAITLVVSTLASLEKEYINLVTTEHMSEAKLCFRSLTHKWFMKGYCFKQSFEKPHGYAGDFEIVDAIYRNKPIGNNLSYALDKFYLDHMGSVAMRSRKSFIVKALDDFIREIEKSLEGIKLLDIGCGPGADIYELLSGAPTDLVKVELLDQDKDALEFCKNRLLKYNFITYTKANILEFIVASRRRKIKHGDNDIVLCIGLFDYFDDNSSSKIVQALYKLCTENGLIVFSNWDISNPCRTIMEWICDWNVYHRQQSNMQNIVSLSKIDSKRVNFTTDETGHFQICVINK